MTNSTPTYDYTVFIDAPADLVFEYCCDPGRIYDQDPMYRVVDAVLTPDRLGTTARLVAKVFIFNEDITLEYVDVVPDRRIVFEAQPTMSLRGLGPDRGISVAIHRWTWSFEPEDGGTRLHLVVSEQDPPRWQRIMDRFFEKGFNTQVRSRLARIKARTEEQAAATP